MKFRILLITASLTVLSSSVLFGADETKKAHEEETELEGKMDKMSGALRKLKRQAPDASKNADSLQQVAIMRTAGEESLKLAPAKAADIPEAGRAKFLADYQAKMKEFLGQLDKLEAALKAGSNDEAVKIVAAIDAGQKEAHKQFKRPAKKE